MAAAEGAETGDGAFEATSGKTGLVPGRSVAPTGVLGHHKAASAARAARVSGKPSGQSVSQVQILGCPGRL